MGELERHPLTTVGNAGHWATKTRVGSKGSEGSFGKPGGSVTWRENGWCLVWLLFLSSRLFSDTVKGFFLCEKGKDGENPTGGGLGSYDGGVLGGGLTDLLRKE